MEFNHTPVMLNECLNALDIKSNGIYVDGTLGGAGHSSEILRRIPQGRLICIDKDEEAIRYSAQRLSSISDNYEIVHNDFKNFEEVMNNLNIQEVDGILLDLGVSSYQLDNAERGFSYRFDAKLDMRMDKSKDFCAYDIVNGYSEKDLARIIYQYGEDKFGGRIAKAIVDSRKNKPIETTGELVNIIENTVPKKFQLNGSPCKKTFQAIRIEVNKELTDLDTVLYQMINRLKVGGRLVVITFHSLEDRIVKNVFKEESTNCICDKHIPVCVCNHKAKVKQIVKAEIATDEELSNNKRSKSAKLRVVQRI